MSRRVARGLVQRLAFNAGLRVVGVTSAEPFLNHEAHLVAHVRAGHLGGLDWFTEQRAREVVRPATLHETAQSIISVGVPFWSGHVDPPQDGVLRGRIARYAWGVDYHKILKRRMRELAASLERETGLQFDTRQLSDTARTLDRAIAARAGAGWVGKNTMVIVPGHGSWVMLGEIMLDAEIEPDAPMKWDCGRCMLCIDNCPTGAIVEPYRVHTPSCISFLTIEERGPIPHSLRPLMGDHVFGCDICQDVCPYTLAAKPVEEPEFAPRSVDNAFPSLQFLVEMSEAQFREMYSGTPVTRPKRAGIARNAAIALGNAKDVDAARPLLEWTAREHEEPLARGHAAYALQTLLGPAAEASLVAMQTTEHDRFVLDEITAALAALDR